MMILRVLAVVAFFALGGIGLAKPTSIVLGGACWLAFLFGVLSGWGYLVARLTRVAGASGDDTADVAADFGLRALWGAAAYLAVAGVLLAVGYCNRAAVLALVSIGAVGFAWREMVTDAPAWVSVRDALAFIRKQPSLGGLVVAFVLLVGFQLLGAIVQLDRNPWDDDIAYTPLVTRLLDTGDLVEPFSFRRLGAYGGQTVLQALGAVRGDVQSVHLVDRGLCLGLTLLLVLGHARRVRATGLPLALVVLVLLLLPDNAVNTASYWSGTAFFIGLYRTVVHANEADKARSTSYFALAALVAAATCTLRQNYIAVAVVFVALSLASGNRDRRTWAICAAVGFLVVVQYAFAAYASSGTFLFPFWTGTWNDAIDLTPGVITWVDRLEYVLTVCIETSPVYVVPVLALVLVFVRDHRPGRPLTCLFASSVIGFLILATSFHDTESFHLWRYAFGFATALLAMLALDSFATPGEPRTSDVPGDEQTAPLIGLPALGRWLLLAALVLQVAIDRDQIVKRYASIGKNVSAARKGEPGARVDEARYTALQASVPAGAPLLVMLDDPRFLDFSRNPIANVDTPGFASPDPGLPAFQGPDALRAYLRGRGIRFVAFVRSDASRYFYRRGFWVWRLFNDAEMFQAMSAYTIDMIDVLADLAATDRVLYDEGGLVALELASVEGASTAVARRHDGESALRELFVRRIAEQEQLLDAWSLTTRAEIRFEDGFSGLAFLDERVDDPKWYDATHPVATPPKRGTAARWMHRRSHLRLRSPHGRGAMRLVLRGKANVAALNARPRLDVALDGELVGSATLDGSGRFSLELVIAPGTDWRDLYLVWTSVAQPEKDVRDLRVARLEQVVWEPK